MGVYIPNMDKPKRCGKCDLWSNCFYPKNPYTEQDDYIAPDCPLEEVDDIAFGLYKAYIDGIEPPETPKEIVRCKECMYWHEHEWYNTCDKHIGHGFPSDYFCGDGERRTDE